MRCKWTDALGDSHTSNWWIDVNNGIHIKDKREDNYAEATPYDVSAVLEILNKKESYEIANRIWGLGEETTDIRNAREDLDSQNSYFIRDTLLSDMRYKTKQHLDDKT